MPQSLPSTTSPSSMSSWRCDDGDGGSTAMTCGLSEGSRKGALERFFYMRQPQAELLANRLGTIPKAWLQDCNRAVCRSGGRALGMVGLKIYFLNTIKFRCFTLWPPQHRLEREKEESSSGFPAARHSHSSITVVLKAWGIRPYDSTMP